MGFYRVVYRCNDGYEDEVVVYATSKYMAFVVFENCGYDNVVNTNIFKIIEEE